VTKYVWIGTSVAIGASLILGISIWVVYRVLSEPVQVLFEGLAALLAVVVISSMIFWLATKGTAIKKEIESRVESVITSGAKFALASFAFVAVFREALETVLFLTPFLSSQFLDTLIGAVLGILASAVLSYGVFAVGMRIDVRRFFFVTSVMLVLLAGGLAGYGVHELIEYSEFTG
jgi:high-affinity iron transporter